MSNLRYRWLKWRGYTAIQVIMVNHRWDTGDPITHRSAELVMQKGLNFKTIKFEQDVAVRLRKSLEEGKL